MNIKALIFILALAISMSLTGGASAQVADFPSGCASGLGYSVTTGEPCNGTNDATDSPMPGCSGALGYSVTTGEPCSGGDEALVFLGGCSSIYGYSTINGQACNGTAVAVFPVTQPPVFVPSVPSLPTTGMGDALANFLFLGSSALIVLLGLVFLIRGSRV